MMPHHSPRNAKLAAAGGEERGLQAAAAGIGPWPSQRTLPAVASCGVNAALHARSGVRAFTLIEMLVVIAIIGILSSLMVGLAGMAARKRDDARTRAMLAELVTAIEAYKAKYSTYPPDSSTTAAFPYGCNTNSLFYELTGATFSGGAAGTFSSPVVPGVALSSATLVSYFGPNCAGILNATDPALNATAKNFLPSLKAGNYAPINNGLIAASVTVLLVPGRTDHTDTNTWYYLAAPNARRNPTTFDLWAERVIIKGATQFTNVIGNW